MSGFVSREARGRDSHPDNGAEDRVGARDLCERYFSELERNGIAYALPDGHDRSTGELGGDVRRRRFCVNDRRGLGRAVNVTLPATAVPMIWAP